MMIEIENTSNARVFVAVDSERRSLTRSVDEHSSASTSSTSVGGSASGEVKGPKGGGGSLSMNVSRSSSRSSSSRREREWQVTEGPAAGARSLDPYQRKAFTVLGRSANSFFVSVLDQNGDILRENAPFDVKSQRCLIWNNGLSVDRTLRPAILSGAAITLKRSSGSYVGVPVWAKNWPCGNLDRSACAHHIEATSNGPLTSGCEVRLRTSRDITGDGYTYMYCSDKGWVYYDQRSSNTKQVWYINKLTQDGSRDDVIRRGDSVTLTNKSNSRYYLRDYDGQWLACETERSNHTFVIDID